MLRRIRGQWRIRLSSKSPFYHEAAAEPGKEWSYRGEYLATKADARNRQLLIIARANQLERYWNNVFRESGMVPLEHLVFRIKAVQPGMSVVFKISAKEDIDKYYPLQNAILKGLNAGVEITHGSLDGEVDYPHIIRVIRPQ